MKTTWYKQPIPSLYCIRNTLRVSFIRFIIIEVIKRGPMHVTTQYTEIMRIDWAAL